MQDYCIITGKCYCQCSSRSGLSMHITRYIQTKTIKFQGDRQSKAINCRMENVWFERSRFTTAQTGGATRGLAAVDGTKLGTPRSQLDAMCRK